MRGTPSVPSRTRVEELPCRWPIYVEFPKQIRKESVNRGRLALLCTVRLRTPYRSRTYPLRLAITRNLTSDSLTLPLHNLSLPGLLRVATRSSRLIVSTLSASNLRPSVLSSTRTLLETSEVWRWPNSLCRSFPLIKECADYFYLRQELRC